ncbi:MAG TPA: ABC transporter ATP-binding protein, partial [Lentisphaeria bacterium]|nr:ABC transporter ATP-binding protein [Lentisphaeria bacterium]
MKNTPRTALRHFVGDICWKFPWLLICTASLFLGMSCFDAAAILTLAPVVDLLMGADSTATSAITKQMERVLTFLGIPMTLWSALAAFFVFNVVKNAFAIFALYTVQRTKFVILRHYMLGTFDDFFSARWRFFSEQKQGTLVNTFLHEVNVVGEAVIKMAQFLSTIIQIVLLLAVPFMISWQLTSLSLLGAGVIAIPFLIAGRISYRFGKQTTSTSNDMYGILQESCATAKIVQGFGNQARNRGMFSEAFDCYRRAMVKGETLNSSILHLYQPLGLVILIIALLAAQRLNVPISETAVLIYALMKTLPSVGTLTSLKASLENFTPSYEQMMRLRKVAREDRQPEGGRPFATLGSGIEVKNVSFTYPGRDMVLNDISLSIPAGKMTAVVGESGCGKSTLLDMLMGFNMIERGDVLIDGVSLKDYDQSSYRQRIGYVPQDAVLFNMSIRDNILWAQANATDETLAEALRLANAQVFIDEFPDGVDTIVGDRGVRLSGGQIQRIALARAILRRPELLILDEATSALDSQSETLIQDAIAEIARDTTIIVVAHRLSTVKMADTIVVLDEGAIVEQG